mgnify:CR=1 FL=1
MITPLDIENKKFSKQMVNGYNVDEVDEFLDEITADYEKLYKENKELKENTEELHNDVGQYRTIESTLQNTLVIAQKTADEIQNVAKQQAEQIIKDAEHQAKTRLDELNTQIMIKEKELNELKKQFSVYKAKMESLLISQLELIKDMAEEEEWIKHAGYKTCIFFLSSNILL